MSVPTHRSSFTPRRPYTTSARVASRPATKVRVLSAETIVAGTFATCLFLQRFAFPFGTLEISVSTPIVLLLGLWGIHSGALVIHRRRAAYFFGLCACAMVATGLHATAPLAIAPRTSVPSLLYWLAVTGLVVLRFRVPMDEDRFFRIFTGIIDVVAVAGIAQFVAQFVGLSLFSFAHLVPSQLLIESQYNVAIPIFLYGTNAFKSNGFFLVEPSVFSQFMAIAVIVEWLLWRRLSRLVLYLTGLLVSVSGTGWLILCVFLVVLTFASGLLGSLRALGLAAACVALLAVGSYVSPDIIGALTGRLGEFTLQGSSGYQRFVTPVLLVERVLDAAPWTFFTGIGPGASTKLLVPFFYNVDTPTKIFLEYGIGGFIFYLLLLLDAKRTATQWLLTGPLLVLLMFAGGYQEFSPVLFPVLMIGSVALLQRRDQARF